MPYAHLKEVFGTLRFLLTLWNTAVVLVFGLIRLYSRPPLLLTSSPLLLVMGYVVLALPYMYRAVDNGLKAMDVRALTEPGIHGRGGE